ncbi:M48 family metalloprotease [Cesiribacter andamanensis]|uniref:Putative Zn-dependent protease n=1 Tax=Cesiribacter andamanensis AMV16 TaxID=1279009 RepID=M7N9F6_9BACT|nr:M48 family metalloprotease [Cesiribacter andamanensis]EMR03821.1 Putative Zn-dependent protease [Cesiribacter andamanensis AMV16]
MRKYALSCLLLTALLLFDSCATNPVTGKRQVSLVSTNQEIAMGQQADPQIVAQFGLYEDPAMQRFIQEKGQQMAAISHRKELNYEFKILDSPVINAFAVPGGYVYFTRGIMAHFNDEAQFAGVLGHEIGHITARHSAQQQTKATLAQGGLLLGMVISPEFAQFGNTAAQGLQLLFLKHGRDDERESDRLGVEYSTKIGYDAAQMANFFQTLQRQSASTGQEPIPNFLSTHPDPGERYETVHQLAAEWKQKANLTNAQINRNNYLRMLEGMIYGEDPKQGFVENGVFYHPELRFQFPVPANWRHQNSPQAFQMAAPDGKAMMMLTLAQGNSLQEAAQNTMEQYKLQPVESQNTTVNGLPALAVIADLQQQQGTLRTLSYFIQYGGVIYSLMGVSAAQDFNSYAQLFSSTMQSFRELTDASKLNRQPERLRIVPVQQTTSLEQALRSNQIPNDRLEEFAILNGMQLNEQVPSGTLIKVVRR